MFHLTSEEINKYCEQYSSVEPDLLSELNRQTYLKTELPHMVSGHLQGRALSMISHMLKPNYILEIGTFTGYSALCLAEGLQSNGKLVTIEINPEQADMALEFVEKSLYVNQIEIMVGKALDIIPFLNYEFDLVFIDADKVNYSNYFDLIISKVTKGGYIIADNVLFHGEVLKKEGQSKNAAAMEAYNKKLANDTRVENVLLPIRDGLLISRKK